MDASSLGETSKEGKYKKTSLSDKEEKSIVETFRRHEEIDGFTTVVSYEQIRSKDYSLSAGQYFQVKNNFVDISPDQFNALLLKEQSELSALFSTSQELDSKITKILATISYAK
jgi:type I restriction enzyme M protein